MNSGHYGHPLMGGFSGGPRTFEPIPNAPGNGGSGIFRRPVDGGALDRSRTGPRRVVYITTPASPDTEPGGNPTIAPRRMMFQRDGRLVPIMPGSFAGAVFGAPVDEEGLLGRFFWITLFSGTLVGALFGAVLSNRKRSGRAIDSAIGAGLGAAAAAGVAVVAGRAAVISSKLKAA